MQTDKEQLEIYYYIDLKSSEMDKSVIIKYLQIYTSINYNVIKFENFASTKSVIIDPDPIKNGLNVLTKMHKELSLKSSENIKAWFLYICNGNITDEFKNVDIIMLNKNIKKNECLYNIDKKGSILNIKLDISKEEKMKQLKIFKCNLETMLSSERVIKY